MLAPFPPPNLDTHRSLAVLVGLATGWQRTAQLPRQLKTIERLDHWLSVSRDLARDPAAPPHVRAYALQLLSLNAHESDLPLIAALIDPATPTTLQDSAIDALAASSNPRIPSLLLGRWASATGPSRRKIMTAMLTSDPRVIAALDALEQFKIAPGEIEPVPRYYLTHWPNATLRQRAEKIFKQSAEARQAVIDRYQPALTLTGNASRGQSLFVEKTCIVCHTVRGVGGHIGPDLSAIASRPPRQLLEDILDPSRQVSPDFISYSLTTTDGQTHLGILASETAAQIVLRQPDGQELTLPRTKIKTLQSTGRSLMPEGLESAINPQDMADLVAYLRGG